MFMYFHVCVSVCVRVRVRRCTDDGGELARGDGLFGNGQVTVGTHGQLVVRDRPAGVAWGANMAGWNRGGSMTRVRFRVCVCVCV